jgi:predicted HD phosphohydrolase
MIDQVLDDIFWLFENRGGERYEPHEKLGVTQLEHALQTATLAEAAGANDALVTAALLHDLGHMMCMDDEDCHGVDDFHEYRALPLLRSAFDESVLGPITLHEAAKRMLSATEPAYYATLSPLAKRALMLQGGPFCTADATQFIVTRFAREAILICRWGDRATIPRTPTENLAHFLAIARRAAKACSLASRAVVPERAVAIG